MKPASSRIESLRQMISLEERRSKLQDEISAIEQHIAALQKSVFSGAAAQPAPAPARGRPAGTGKRARRGALKQKIEAALEAAGSGGVRVKELAEALGTKPVNIHAWFHSNMKTNPRIIKISGGHYRIGNGSKAAAAPAPAAKPAKGSKAAKAPKAPKAGGRRKGSKRGQLSARILDLLKEAGDKGISVSDLAAKLGIQYRNTYVWFATTGKKNPAIKKVGPATYKLAA